jgi:CheY-like chemotaxis protein
LRMGAMGALTKPVRTRETLDDTFDRLKRFIAPHERSALVVEPDEAKRAELAGLVGGDGVRVVAVPGATEALEAVKARKEELAGSSGGGAAAGNGDGQPAAQQAFDLVVTSLDLGDRKAFDLIDDLAEEPALRDVPVIVYSHRELGKKEEVHLKRLGQTMALKDVRSPERLVDEAALFLHRAPGSLPPAARGTVERLHTPGAVLAGKKVLIVDDDIRNIFAMTSLLEPYKMNVLSAETGRAAIETLQQTADVDVVLMDIMMPDMDGYDTMRAIRKLAKFRSLPIIALTAKAMKGDREKCIEAGASDYISKPVDTDQLLAMLRVWLYR